MPMKYDIATNFDDDFIRKIASYKVFDWVYGKLNNDLVGGGRPSIMLPKINWKQIKKHVNVCHKNDIKFNYLLNALCMGNKEVQKRYHLDLISLIRTIEDVGIDGVTVASPYLCSIIKKQFPRLYVSISIYNKVTTLTQMKYWMEMGADEITLFHTINRDFETLKKMLEYTRGRGIRLRLIANNLCLHECPYHANHAVCHAHGSQAKDYSSKLHIDYYVFKCQHSRIKNPARFLSSEWIRPEDIGVYENICRQTKNPNLTIKLTERGRETQWLLETAKAYADRSYSGNLLNIMNYIGTKKQKDFNKGPMYLKSVTGLYNLKRLFKMKKLTSADFVYLDNKKLDGFINKFLENNSCNDVVCNDEGWNGDRKDKSSGNHGCSYCGQWAKKALSFDEKSRENYLSNLGGFIEDLEYSRIFNLF